MRRATVEQLAEAPVGLYVAGDTFVHFCAAPTLWGVILWGRPDATQAQLLGRSLVRELKPPAVPHASIIDASRLSSADPAAFAATELYVRHYHAKLAHHLTRLALVRPPGLGGAVVAGAFGVMPPPYPVQVFASPAEGAAWLRTAQGAADWPADVPALLARLHAEACGTPVVLAELRAYLATHLAGLAVANAARDLGMSERSLQRKLGEHGTTFQDEVADARIRAAKVLLVDSDAPLTHIALDVGCASLQHFSALFRKRERESPSAYRKRMQLNFRRTP